PRFAKRTQSVHRIGGRAVAINASDATHCSACNRSCYRTSGEMTRLRFSPPASRKGTKQTELIASFTNNRACSDDHQKPYRLAAHHSLACGPPMALFGVVDLRHASGHSMSFPHSSSGLCSAVAVRPAVLPTVSGGEAT